MSRPSDETLMAYADGALSEPERDEVEAHLEHDPEARALVEMFQATARLAGEAHELPPLDAESQAREQALIERILAAPLPADQEQAGGLGGARIIPIAGRLTRRPRQAIASPLALAASLALAIGLAGGWLLSRTIGGPTAVQLALGPVQPASDLQRVLETQPGGQARGRLLVVATFKDRRDRFCREVEVLTTGSGPQVPEIAGVACRGGDGRWVVEGAARIAAAEQQPGGVVPSGTDENDALRGLMDMLGAKAAIAAREEADALARGWK